MTSMSLDTEQLARREWEAMTEPDKVRVKIRTSWKYGFCMPDRNGDEEEQALFRVLTFGDNHIIDKAVSYEMEVRGMGRQTSVTASDINEFRRLLVKKNLLGWTLDIPIERMDGWMTSDCYERVRNIPAPLMDAFLNEFEARCGIGENEEQKMMRQAAILFGKNSRGVADACEAVSLYCTLGNFWEKFGIGKRTLPDLPYREYLMLKVMVGKEAEAMRVQAAPKKQSTTRIAGRGGRVRPSVGRRVPM